MKISTMKNKRLEWLLLIIVTFIIGIYIRTILTTQYLSFSDAAKFALVAKNMVSGEGISASFSFFYPTLISDGIPVQFPLSGMLPFMPISISLIFRLFGVSDFSIIFTSAIFYILILLSVYFLTKRVYKNNITAILAVLVVSSNQDLIQYASSGASETAFIFQIIATLLLISLRKKWTNILAICVLILMYFTRSQAFIYIAGTILYYLLLNYEYKKALVIFLVVSIASLIFDRVILASLSGNFYIYSISAQGNNIAANTNDGGSVSNMLRGYTNSEFSISLLLKKIFYNLYNFYRAVPQIMNPYLSLLFAIGLFIKSKTGEEKTLKIVSCFIVLLTIFVTAASIPFYRYLHPIIPLVYIVGVGTLSGIITKKNPKHLTIILTFLVMFFAVWQSLGIIFLDSRFNASRYNFNKPPVYVQLSKVLEDHTKNEDIVLTNLDTWGSWYGNRKTIWFPLSPSMIIPAENNYNQIDAIYLTNYRIDDENYYMGSEWRQIFEDPENHRIDYIRNNYRYVGRFEINATDTYENQDAWAILLVRNNEISL